LEGFLAKDNRKSQAAFACVECGFAENADLVGAINVLTQVCHVALRDRLE